VSDAGTPGWYPDPYRRYELRYFNGQRWTGDVSVQGRRMIDPVNGGQAAPTATGVGRSTWPGTGPVRGPAGQQWQPGGAPRPQWSAGPGPTGTRAPGPKRGMAITAFIVAVASAAIGWFPFAFTIAGAGVVVAVVFGIIGLRRAKQQGGAGRGFAVAALVISPVALAVCVGGFFFTRFVVREINRYDDPGDYALTKDSCTAEGTLVTFSGTIRNDGSDTRSYELSVSYGSNGRQLGTDFVDVDDVHPGDTADWSDTQRVSSADGIACDVTDVHGPPPFGIRPT
jgi:hypothetical protein